MVKLKVSLLVFHGIPSTFVSSTRLGFNNESAYDCSSKTFNLFSCLCFLMNIISSFELLFHFEDSYLPSRKSTKIEYEILTRLSTSQLQLTNDLHIASA